MSAFLRFGGDERGSMAVLFAVALGLGMLLGAYAIDAASLYGERREAQAATDLAAIAAAQAVTNEAQALVNARAILVAGGLLAASGPANGQLVLERGRYTPDAGLAAGQRFVAGGTPYNAVRLRYTKTGRLYFAQGWSTPPTIGVEAIASATPMVALSAGSGLLNFEGGVVNALLDQLLGTKVSVSVATYSGLLDAKVELLQFLDALAQELGVSVGTYDDLLNLTATQGQLTGALARVLTGTQQVAAQTLKAAMGPDKKLRIGDLIDLGAEAQRAVGSGTPGLGISLSALSLLTAGATVADGQNQVNLNLGVGVPGIASIETRLIVGQPPQGASWFALGPSGTIVRTGQVRLRLIVHLLGSPLLLDAGVRLPVFAELAYGEASVISASCPPAGERYGGAVIGAQPGVARLAIGEMSSAAFADFSKTPVLAPANIIDLLLLKVTGSVDIRIASPAPVPLTFTPADVRDGVTKRARTTGMVTSLGKSLVDGLDLNIEILGLGLGTKGVIEAALRALLVPVGPVIDLVLDTLLRILGLSLGTLDVKVHAVTCDRAVLVG